MQSDLKRIVPLLISLLFVFALGACNASAPEDAASQSAASGKAKRDKRLGMSLDARSYLRLSASSREQMLKKLSASGIGFVRIEYNAFNAQNQFADEADTRDRFIRLVKALHSKGIHVLLLVDYMSYRSSGIPKSNNTLQYTQGEIEGKFVPALIDAKNGLLLDFYRRADIRAFEIWNEPNYTWHVDPEVMASALHKVYQFKKAHMPLASIVAAGIESSRGENKNGENPIAGRYMQELYQRIYQGGRSSLLIDGHPPFDAIGVHPYHWRGEDIVRNLNSVYLKTMQAQGDKRTRLWITEIGSQQPDDDAHWTETKEIIDLFDSDRMPRVDKISFFTSLYFDRSANGFHYSFLRSPSEGRRSFAELQRYVLSNQD